MIIHGLFIGELRHLVEDTRAITSQEEAVLDKIKRVHVFFKNLEGICGAIKEVNSLVSLTISSSLMTIEGSSLY